MATLNVHTALGNKCSPNGNSLASMGRTVFLQEAHAPGEQNESAPCPAIVAGHMPHRVSSPPGAVVVLQDLVAEVSSMLERAQALEPSRISMGGDFNLDLAEGAELSEEVVAPAGRIRQLPGARGLEPPWPTTAAHACRDPEGQAVCHVNASQHR